MTTLTKIAIVASAFTALGTHISLASAAEYRLIAFANCKVVAEHALNQAQISAYQDLKAAEVKMESTSQPVKSIEDDIESYTDQINELTSRAIKEDSDSLYIDKKLLREQEKVVQKLESVIKAHEGDFVALEKEAQVIAASARKFEHEIQSLLIDVEYDFVRIQGPDDRDGPYACDDKNITMITM